MEIKHLSFSYGKSQILKDISLKFKDEKITTVLGANGYGKSTLFKICVRELEADIGKITLNGKDIKDMNTNEFAKKVSIVHQKNKILGDISVRKLVSFGRNPYVSFMRSMSKEDEEYIDEAIELCSLKDISNKSIHKLSGGQVQRAWIAMAIAQKTKVLFLDEPTTYLDIKYQIEILELVKSLNEKLKTTIIMVLHDINQSIEYSDEIIGIYRGKKLFQGNPKLILNEELISQVYDTALEINRIGTRIMVMNKGGRI